MLAFKSETALFVPNGNQLSPEEQVKLMMLTSEYGMILFMEPPANISVIDVTEEVKEKLKS